MLDCVVRIGRGFVVGAIDGIGFGRAGQIEHALRQRDLGYGAGYEYDHAKDEAFSGQNYFPDGMARERFYRPRDRGFEREIAKRLEYWAELRATRSPGA